MSRFQVFGTLSTALTQLFSSNGAFIVPSYSLPPPSPDPGCLYYNFVEDGLYISNLQGEWISLGGGEVLGPKVERLFHYQSPDLTQIICVGLN